ncbi:MAG TPA: carboxypeptidase regulatory-like domain-containing protein [Terriglobales bacterium]|nr:carboxypeptidase regulatory-like domain-containing protein [Terriglobales bacterium]
MPNSPGQQGSSAHVLTGTVVNSSTGQPIPYALVQVDLNAKLTDQNGNFRFENLLSNPITIQAHKPGFFGQNEIGESRAPTMVTLSDHPTAVTVPLVPEAVITGHVENPEGEPLGGLPVRLRFSQIMNGRRILQQFGNRSTDEDGNFRIADLRPGAYYVEVGPNWRARAVGEEQASGGKFEVVPAEYYPGVREISAATALRLAPGQHASLEFAMKRVPAYRVSGGVSGTTANGGLYFADLDGDHLNVGIRFDRQTGRFQAFPVPAGSYRLRFNGTDADGLQLFADVPIQVTGNIPELHIPVGRTITLPVEYETDFTKQDSSQSMPRSFVYSGPPGADVNAIRQQIFYGQLRLTSRTPPYQQFGAMREKPDGPTVIRGVEPGTYDVEVDTNAGAYVASVTCGGMNLLTEPLVIAEGADPQPIRVVLRDDGASLNGTVQAPDGSQPGLVLMVADGSQSPPRQLWVDGSGKFQAQGVAPGSYEILAFDRTDGVEYRNREVLGAYLSHAAHVTLSAEQQAKVNVDLIRMSQ